MGFTKEQMSKGGSNSKRKSGSDVELLRSAITGKINIDELFYEISEMELNDRVNAKIKLLSFVLPKLQSIDLTATGEMTITQFISLNTSDQDSYLQNLVSNGV